MKSALLTKVFLLVLSTGCVASAYVTPGDFPSSGQYQGGHDDCSLAPNGCWVDPGSGPGAPFDPTPYDPQPGYGHPGYPGHPGHPGYPGHGHQPPPPPPYPGQPGEPPPYPGQPGYPGYDQQVDIQVNQVVYGNQRLDLGTYFNLRSYMGYSIEQVIIQARTDYYQSAALNLIINGFNMGQASFGQNGGYSQSQSIFVRQRPVIGQGADSIMLYSSGQMTIERVTLILSR